MKSTRFYLLALSILVIASHGNPRSAKGQSQKIVGTASIVAFAVWPAGDGPEFQDHKPRIPLLDPIAVYSRNGFQDLPGFDAGSDQKAYDLAFNAFEKRYFRRGSSYPYFLRGAARGSVVIREPYGVDCVSTTASVELPEPLRREERGIALNSLGGIAAHADLDSPPSAAQRMAFHDAAAAVLQTKGVSKMAIQGIKVLALHSIYLGSHWPNFLAGSAFLKQKDALYDLFIVFGQRNGRLSPAITSYHRAADVEDGTDDTQEYLLSHLDFDGDGIDEIITTRFYYESWDYTIYKFQDGAWKAVFNGSGGGC